MKSSLGRTLCALSVGASIALFTTPSFALFGMHGKLPDKPVIDDADAAGRTAATAPLSTSALAQKGVIVGDFGSTSAEITKLMKLIESNSPSPSFHVTVKIDSNPIANAHTLSGGNVVLNAGLIEALQSQSDKKDALAFILAHEYAHAFFNDPATQVEKEGDVNQIGQAVALAANLMGASQTTVGANAGKQCMASTGVDPVQVMAGAVMTGEWVKAELYRFSYGPFSREMETRADFMAVDLLVRAKLNPVAGSQPIEDLYEKYDASVRATLQKQLKNVQNTIESSLKQLSTCAPDMLQQTLNGGSIENQLKGFVKDQLVGWSANFVQSRFSKENVHIYASADGRVSAIHDYVEKFYPGQIADTSTDLSAFTNGADPFGKFGKEDDIYKAADDIIALNAQGKYEDSLKAVSKAEKQYSARPLEFLVAAGTAQQGAGNPKRAISYFETASQKPEATGVVFRALATLYSNTKQPDKALATLDRGETKLKDRKQFIVARIVIYRDKGDTAHVQKLVQECDGMGDKTLAGACHDASGLQTQSTSNALLGAAGAVAKGVVLGPVGAAGSLVDGVRGAVDSSSKSN